jgi:hypothetical protein
MIQQTAFTAFANPLRFSFCKFPPPMVSSVGLSLFVSELETLPLTNNNHYCLLLSLHSECILYAKVAKDQRYAGRPMSVDSVNVMFLFQQHQNVKTTKCEDSNYNRLAHLTRHASFFLKQMARIVYATKLLLILNVQFVN